MYVEEGVVLDDVYVQEHRNQSNEDVENFIVDENDRIEAALGLQPQNVPAVEPMEVDPPQARDNNQVVPMDVEPPIEEPDDDDDDEPNWAALLDDGLDDFFEIELDPELDFSDEDEDEPLNPGGQETLIQHNDHLDPNGIEDDRAIEYAPGQHRSPLSVLLDLLVEFKTWAGTYAGHALQVFNRDRSLNTHISYSRLSKWEVKHKEQRITIDQLLFKVTRLVAFQSASAINVNIRQVQSRGRVTAGQVRTNAGLAELIHRNDGKLFFN